MRACPRADLPTSSFVYAGKLLLRRRRVYSSNTVSAVRERVCLGPSRLRVGGPAKDAGLILLEPPGWTIHSRTTLTPRLRSPCFILSPYLWSMVELLRPRAQRIFPRTLRSFPTNFYQEILSLR